MIINHNISAINANRQLGLVNQAANVDMEKLSSGMRINKARDDASGLAVSEKMRSQIRGLNQAIRNIENGISLIQTTEGYLQSTGEVLQRIRELSVQSANGTYTAEDRMQIQVEVSQLVDEIDRIASHAQFNGMNVLTGRFAGTTPAGTDLMRFHVGSNMDQAENISVGTMTTIALGISNEQGAGSIASISTIESANRTIGLMDEALRRVNRQRADLGAFQNRFELAARSLAIASENTQAAESTIRDTNMAQRIVNFTKNSILTQSSTAMLAQANIRPQGVLQLLG